MSEERKSKEMRCKILHEEGNQKICTTATPPPRLQNINAVSKSQQNDGMTESFTIT